MINLVEAFLSNFGPEENKIPSWKFAYFAYVEYKRIIGSSEPGWYHYYSYLREITGITEKKGDTWINVSYHFIRF